MNHRLSVCKYDCCLKHQLSLLAHYVTRRVSLRKKRFPRYERMRNNVRFEIGSRGGGPSRRDEDKRGATGGETRARSISHMSQAVHTRYTHIRERCVAPSGSGHNRKTTKPRLTTPVNRTRADTRSRKTAVRKRARVACKLGKQRVAAAAYTSEPSSWLLYRRDMAGASSHCG